MKVAALLALLAAPTFAGDPVTPTQARANVVQALPPDIARGAGTGDLQRYLERLSPEKKEEALRSLEAKEGALGNDPATQRVMGQAYAGLGKVKEAREAAKAVLSVKSDDPEALAVLGWAESQDRLRGRDGGGSLAAPAGPGGAVSPAAALSGLAPVERQVQGTFGLGNRSEEFRNTLEDAHGLSVAQLKAAGIQFAKAEPNQQDPVLVTREKGGGFTISLRDDAFSSGGDREARAAAVVANGVRQAQTLRDHEILGPAIIVARGWITGARTHKQLNENDAIVDPKTSADQNLAVSRKLLDRDTYQFTPGEADYGRGMTNMALGQLNGRAPDSKYSLEDLFAYFIGSAGHVNIKK